MIEETTKTNIRDEQDREGFLDHPHGLDDIFSVDDPATEPSVTAEMTEVQDSGAQDVLRNEIVDLEEQLAESLHFELGSHADDEETMTGVSASVLEIQRKRELCRDIHQNLHSGLDQLSSVERQTALLMEYLGKAEQHIKRLEVVETKSDKLARSHEVLVTRNQEMTSTLADQRKTITLLEVKLKSLRETSDNAKTRIARLLEEQQSALVDKAAAESQAAELASEIETMKERLSSVENERDNLLAGLAKARQEADAAVISGQEKDAALTKIEEELATARDLNKKYAMDLDELTSRNGNLKSESIAQMSRNEELAAELSSMRKEFDTILRAKVKRIAELEARVGGVPATTGKSPASAQPTAVSNAQAQHNKPAARKTKGKGATTAKLPPASHGAPNNELQAGQVQH